MPLSLKRLQRIRWIKQALTGVDVQTEVLAQIRQDNRYVGVLEPSEEDGFAFVFITAFPAYLRYSDHIRWGVTVLDRRARA